MLNFLLMSSNAMERLGRRFTFMFELAGGCLAKFNRGAAWVDCGETCDVLVDELVWVSVVGALVDDGSVDGG